MKFKDNSDNAFFNHLGIYASLEINSSQLKSIQLSEALGQIVEEIRTANLLHQELHSNFAIAGLISIFLGKRINQNILDNSKLRQITYKFIEYIAPLYSFSVRF